VSNPELGLLSLLDCAGRSEASDDRNAASRRSHAGQVRLGCELLELRRRDSRRVDGEMRVGIGAERLEDVDLGLEDVTPPRVGHEARVLEVLGTDPDDHTAAAPSVARLEAPAHFPCDAQVPDRCP
jgi:hypothetical protein